MSNKEWDTLKRGDRIRSIAKSASIRRVLKVHRGVSGWTTGIEVTRQANRHLSSLPVYLRRANAYQYKKVA